MDKIVSISEITREFIKRQIESYESVSPEDAERRMARCVDSGHFLSNQTRNWPRSFDEMNGAYKESVCRLFDSNRSLIKEKGKDIPSDFVERYFNSLKAGIERDDNSGWGDGLGYGWEASVIALVSTTVLYALNATAIKAGVDNRAVLEGANSYLSKGNLLWLLEHAEKLVKAIPDELAISLHESR